MPDPTSRAAEQRASVGIAVNDVDHAIGGPADLRLLESKSPITLHSAPPQSDAMVTSGTHV
jgi:hypothetical protein